MSIVRKNQKKLQEAVGYLQKKDQPSITAALAILKDYGHPTVLSEVFNSLEGLERPEQQLVLGFLAAIISKNWVKVK